MRLSPGEQVSLKIAPGRLLRAAGIAYGIPLAALLLAAGIAAITGKGPGDGVAIILVLAGLALGVLVSRRILSRDRACDQYVPCIDRGTDG